MCIYIAYAMQSEKYTLFCGKRLYVHFIYQNSIPLQVQFLLPAKSIPYLLWWAHCKSLHYLKYWNSSVFTKGEAFSSNLCHRRRINAVKLEAIPWDIFLWLLVISDGCKQLCFSVFVRTKLAWNNKPCRRLHAIQVSCWHEVSQ